MSNFQFNNLWTILKDHDEIRQNDSISKELICKMCKKIMINACNVPCGCRFCWTCLETFLGKENKYCPGQTDYCNKELICIDRNVQIDNPINIRISEILVKCPNYRCDCEMELKGLEDHWRICLIESQLCPFSIIGCESKKISMENLKEHLLNDIHPHTKSLMEWINNSKNDFGSYQKMVSETIKEVKYLKTEIENLKIDLEYKKEYITELKRENKFLNDNQNIIKEKQEIETTKINNIIMENLSVNVKLKNIEKSIRNQEIEIQQHKTEIAHLHQDISPLRYESQNIQDITNELNKKHINNSEKQEKMCGEIKQIMDDINTSKSDGKKMDEELKTIKLLSETNDKVSLYLKNKLENQEKESKDILESISTVNITINEVKRSNEKNQNDLSTKVNDITNKYYDLTDTTHQTELKMKKFHDTTKSNEEKLLKISKQNEFVWIIDNWSDKKKEAQISSKLDFNSSQFYSHKNGYNLWLRLFPDGHGKYKGEYLALYFCLASGPFDDILVWPFRYDVTMEIINQETKLAEKSRTFSKDLEEHSANRERQTTERSTGLGFHDFMSLEEVAKLCKNNKLCVKFYVDI